MGIINNLVSIRNTIIQNIINGFIRATYLIINCLSKKNAKLTFEVFSFWDAVFFLCVLQTGIFFVGPLFNVSIQQLWLRSNADASLSWVYGGADWWVSQSFVRLRSQCYRQWLYIAPLCITLRIKTRVVAYFNLKWNTFQKRFNCFSPLCYVTF